MAKERKQIRIEKDDKERISRAADEVGENFSQYIISAALSRVNGDSTTAVETLRKIADMATKRL